jgi:hypothetical protein
MSLLKTFTVGGMFIVSVSLGVLEADGEWLVVNIYIYIYIYIERERERESTFMHACVSVCERTCIYMTEKVFLVSYVTGQVYVI